MFRFILITIPALLLMSCTQKPIITPKLLPDYAASGELWINVAKVGVVNDFQPTFHSPNIEHHLQPRLTDEIVRWSATRLKAGGSRGRLELHITDASVTETPILNNEHHSERYDTSIVTEAKLYDGEAILASAIIQTRVSQAHTIGSNATLADREALFSHIIADSMRIFNDTIDSQIKQYFNRFLMQPPRHFQPDWRR